MAELWSEFDQELRTLIDQLDRTPNVRVMLGTEVRELLGDRALEAVAVADGRTGGRSVLPARALFVLIGVRPCTKTLPIAGS